MLKNLYNTFWKRNFSGDNLSLKGESKVLNFFWMTLENLSWNVEPNIFTVCEILCYTQTDRQIYRHPVTFT